MQTFSRDTDVSAANGVTGPCAGANSQADHTSNPSRMTPCLRSFLASGPRLTWRLTLATAMLAVVCYQNAFAVTGDAATTTLPSLEPPTLSGTETADQQRKLIKPLLRGLTFRQFARNSIVAPVRIRMRYLTDDQGQRIGHLGHVAFIVHASLDAFSGDEFADRLLGERPESAPDDLSEAITAQELKKAGVDDVAESERYSRFQFPLLDTIEVTGVARIESQRSETQNRIDIQLDPRFQNRWRRLEGADESGEYQGLKGWVTATKLAGTDALLIEARFVFLEPPTWFTGDNYLRSKLPIVLQEAARNLRRKLKAA